MNLKTYILSFDPAVDVSSIQPCPENPRKSLKQTNPARFAALKESLERGTFSAILVEESTREVVGGHQRLEAALELNVEALPCLFLRDLTPEEKIRIRTADNASWNQWELPELRSQLLQLDTVDIPLLGLDDWILKDLALDPLPLDPEPKPDEKEGFTTFKVSKMPRNADTRIHEILESFMEAHQSTKSAALAAICELYAQNPTSFETE